MAIGTPVSIGTTSNKTAATTVDLTTTAAVPAGALIVVCIALDNGWISGGILLDSITDTASNSYAEAVKREIGGASGDGVASAIWYSKNSAALASGSTITVDWYTSNNPTVKSISAFYCEGIDTTDPLHEIGTAIGTSSTPSVSTAAATTQADVLTIGIVGTEGSSGDTFTQDASPAYGDVPVRVGTSGASATSNITLAGGHFIETATGVKTYNPTLGTSRDWAAVIATFKGGAGGLTPSLFTNSNTFYTPTVSTGAVGLAPSLYTDADTFPAATVAANYPLTPSLFTDGDTFYSPTAAASYTLTPALYSDADTFYAATVVGPQTLEPSLYADADTFYAATVGSTYALAPELYADADAFYPATVAATFALAPALYADADTFPTPVVGATYALAPALYSDADTFYSATVSATYALAPDLYVDADSFYAPTVAATYGLAPSLYSDTDAFHAPAVQSVYALQPVLHVDADTFYTPVVALGSSQTLVPGLYVNSDTSYSPTVSSTYTLTPALHADPDTFYSATISSTYVIVPTQYVDADTFYAATVGASGGPQTLLPSLYVDPDTFYVHTVTGGLGSGIGQRTRYITVEFYDSGDMWRTNIARDILEYSAQPSKIAFSYMSPQDTIAYSLSTDKIHYAKGQVMGSIQRRSAFKKVFVAPPPPPPVISKKHWRIYVTATTVADYVSAQEIEMTSTVGGANICTGGAPISSGELGGYPLSNAFDGNRGGGIDQCWVSPSQTMPQWVGYSFAADTAVASVIWVIRNWANVQTPKDFQVQYADDVGGPWTTIATFTGVTWSSAGQAQEFSW